MTWERTAERYLPAFESARRGHRIRVIARLNRSVPSPGSQAPPEMQIGHLLSMCDDTGLFQHAVYSVPDRSHGAAAINIGRPRWTADPQSSLECATNGTAETWSELSITPLI